MIAASWVLTCISSGEVFETFDKQTRDEAIESGLFNVEPITEYLPRLNKEIKEI